MEFLSERYAHLSRLQRFALGTLAVLGSGLLVTGCASSGSSGTDPSQVKYCTFTAEMVGYDELQITTSGVPNDVEAQITRVKIFEYGSSRHHDETAIGDTVRFRYNYDNEYVHVFGIYGTFVASRSAKKRLQMAMHPPRDAVSYWCVNPSTT
ncbi:MAG TPA: hypothetical protein VLG47_07055 [Candidatus Saccharimonadales bacterium]|nr:hypothetical protein [Candidatus Saccharimonadales bacterium]